MTLKQQMMMRQAMTAKTDTSWQGVMSHLWLLDTVQLNKIHPLFSYLFFSDGMVWLGK